MAQHYSVYMLESSNISVSGGKSLDGVTQGDGSHLVGETITLNNNAWLETHIRDNGDSNFDDNDGNQKLDQAVTINGTNYGAGTKVEAEYKLTLQDSAGNTYEVLGYNVNNSSPAYGTVEGLSFVGPPQGWPPVGEPLTVVSAAEGPGSSGQPAIASSDLVVPCFTPGTQIETPDGPVPVETLAPGDLVLTRDHGPQPLRWVGHKTLTAADLAANPKLRPIRIRADAFGPDQPSRDMLLSPQHRLVVTGWQTELMFGSDEMLAAAGHLKNRDGIETAGDVGAVRYIHLMFDNHQIIFADGLETESFRPGRFTVAGLLPEAREELLTLFPELRSGDASSSRAARPLLRAWETALVA